MLIEQSGMHPVCRDFVMSLAPQQADLLAEAAVRPVHEYWLRRSDIPLESAQVGAVVLAIASQAVFEREPLEQGFLHRLGAAPDDGRSHFSLTQRRQTTVEVLMTRSGPLNPMVQALPLMETARRWVREDTMRAGGLTGQTLIAALTQDMHDQAGMAGNTSLAGAYLDEYRAATTTIRKTLEPRMSLECPDAIPVRVELARMSLARDLLTAGVIEDRRAHASAVLGAAMHASERSVRLLGVLDEEVPEVDARLAVGHASEVAILLHRAGRAARMEHPVDIRMATMRQEATREHKPPRYVAGLTDTPNFNTDFVVTTPTTHDSARTVEGIGCAVVRVQAKSSNTGVSVRTTQGGFSASHRLPDGSLMEAVSAEAIIAGINHKDPSAALKPYDSRMSAVGRAGAVSGLLEYLSNRFR